VTENGTDQPGRDCASRPASETQQQLWTRAHQKPLLDKGKIEKLAESLRSITSRDAEIAKKLRGEAEYFEKTAERMRHLQFRRQHLFIGSGVIEAGCKTVIGSRLKQFRHVLDGARSQRHPRPTLMSSQRQP
jgi:hypothetical protein